MADALVRVVRRAAHHADHLVALGEQQLGQVGAVLARHPRNERGPAGLPGSRARFRFRPLCGVLRTHCRRIELWLECARFVAKVPSRDITSATRTTRPPGAGTPTYSAFGSS